MSTQAISYSQLLDALSLRDLSNPDHGTHAMQQLITETENVISSLWSCYVQRVNNNPIVPVTANYDALGYPTDGAARNSRYSRYLSDTLMLRTQTSSSVPAWLNSWQSKRPHHLALISHGLVYRRDCIDRWHSATPHQMDIWLIVPKADYQPEELLSSSLSALLSTLLPNHEIKETAASHPYTQNGLQLDALESRDWIEIGECGHIHPKILDQHGWPSERYTGIAIGLGLDRLMMLRKGIPDIRLLRDIEPRVQKQMLDLTPWKPVSRQPITERDLSIVVDKEIDMDIIGDKVRRSLGEKIHWLEDIKLKSRTPYEDLPEAAINRLGMRPDQDNLLIRLCLRHPTKSVPTALANDIRNTVYLALNQGARTHLAI